LTANAYYEVRIILSIFRWDTSMEDLPDYMKLFFEALIGFFDEIEQETGKEGRPYCVHYSREMVYIFSNSFYVS